MADEEVPPEVADGLEKSLGYLAGSLLEERHYSKLHASFAAKWDRNQSLLAAVKLMEQHGVKLSEEDEQQLGNMDEEQMIDTLVAKMPSQSKEEFQNFFMKLQLVVSTAARIRQALEDCRVDIVQAALEDAENTGIANCILKMALVQAGSQVISLKQQHAGWVRDAEGRMSKLLRGQEDVMHCRKRLAMAEGKLNAFEMAHKDKAMKVLESLLSGQATALAKLCLISWSATAKEERIENEVWQEYQERVEYAQKTMLEANVQKKAMATCIMGRAAKGKDVELLEECFNALRDEARKNLEDKVLEAQLGEMKSKLQEFSDSQVENAIQVMARMMSGMDSMLLGSVWQAWYASLEEMRHERQSDEAVKQANVGLQKTLAKGKDDAAAIVCRLQLANDRGLLFTLFKQWEDHWIEEKHTREMSGILASTNSKLVDFSGRNLDNSRNTMEKASACADQVLLLHVFTQWSLDSRLNQIYNSHHRRLDGKRKQLGKVQTMFREFATQLEEGLKQSLEADSHWAHPARGHRKQLSKSDGTVSLPDIHAGPSSKQSGHHQSAGYPPEERQHDAPQVRQAWH